MNKFGTSFKIISSKITGNPDSSGWSQTYEFTPEDEERLMLRGKLFALISTSSQKEGLDTVVVGREVLLRLHEEYFGKTKDVPFEALKKAVGKVIDEFSSWENVQIAAIAYVNNIVYLASGGGSQIYIFREGKLVKLVNSRHSQVVIASGYPKEADTYTIGTQLFFNSFPKGVLKGFLQSKDPKLVAESFAPLVHSQDLEGGLGIMILNFAPIFSKEKLPGLKTSPEKHIERFKEKYTPKFNVKSNFSGIFRILGNSGLYLKNFRFEETTNPRKKTSALVGILLLTLLIVSTFFGILQKRRTELKESYQSQITSAEHELQEAYDLAQLNPQRSRELFDQARGRVLGLSSFGIEDPKISDLQAKINDGQEKILGRYQLEPELYVDLSLFSQGFEGQKVAFSDEVIFILDEVTQKIISVSAVNKKTQNLAGATLANNAKQIAAYSGRLFTLNTDGIYELDEERKKVIEAEWEGDVLVHSYAGNLYILDKVGSKIYRYSGSSDGFGSQKEWLVPGTIVNLTGAKNIYIDGAVWVISGNKDILKFTFGVLQDFSFKGVFPEINNIDDFFTSENSEYVYLLDKSNERVVVIDKEGEYKAQYVNGKIKEVQKVIVAEKERKLFLLTGGKLLFLELKHL